MNSETQDILTGLLDGQLTAEQAAEVRARLEREPNLQKLYEQLELQRAQLRGVERVTASPDFAARVAAAVRARAGAVALPAAESDEAGPRGGWRSVYLLACSLAALLMLGVFLWPRDVADSSSQVAQTDSQLKRKELQTRQQERDLALNASEPEPSAIRRAPSGGLPQAASGVAVGEAEDAEASERFDRQSAGGGRDARPDSLAGEAGVPGAVAPRSAAPDVAAPDVAAPDVANLAETAPAEAPMELRADGNAEEGGVAGAKLDEMKVKAAEAIAKGIAPALEVWVVGIESAEAFWADKPAAGVTESERGVELYLATVEQSELPAWLEELRGNAQITQLDSAESTELLNQLAAAEQLLGGQQIADADDKAARESQPSEVAEAILDDRPAAGGAESRSARGNVQVGLNVAYLGIEKSQAIAAVVNRANLRQLNTLNAPADSGANASEQAGAAGQALPGGTQNPSGIQALGGGGGGAAAGGAAAGLEANNELLARQKQLPPAEKSQQAWLESNRLQLREQANRFAQEELPAGSQLQRANRQLGLGGRQIIIVIPPQK